VKPETNSHAKVVPFQRSHKSWVKTSIAFKEYNYVVNNTKSL